MTKDQELAILRKAIQDLRIDSYLGPWLASITDELERDLRSDFIPVITLAEARRRAANVLSDAEIKASQIVETASQQAKKIEQDAINTSHRVLANLRNELRRAAETLF